MRVVRISKDSGLFVTEFVFVEIDGKEKVWHTVKSYTWLPPPEQVVAWIEDGKHPIFSYT
jgi:hypothetical protein